jgi:hypothetical protein
MSLFNECPYISLPIGLFFVSNGLQIYLMENPVFNLK